MKKFVTYALIGLFATIAVAIDAPEKDAIEAKEKAAWQAYKDKKGDEFKKLLSPNYTSVSADGIQDLQKEMDGMQKSELKSFSIMDYNVVSDEPDTVVSTYKVTMQSTTDGKDVSGTYICASVWKKQNGEWYVLFHTNVKEENPPG